MEVIQNKENSKVKLIVKLQDKKYRDEEKLYVAEGARWVFDAQKHSGAISFIAIKESCRELYGDKISDMSKVFVFSDSVFDRFSQVENNQGILCVAKIIPHTLPLRSDHCLFLDRIRDPGNMGTIIRTALAAGYSDIILNNCVDVYNPKVIRSTMSSVLNVRFIEGKPCVLGDASADGYTIVTADLDGENLFSVSNKPKKVVLVIGNEAEGISDEVKAYSQKSVRIPMENIESLNASVSAGILMYFFKH